MKTAPSQKSASRASANASQSQGDEFYPHLSGWSDDGPEKLKAAMDLILDQAPHLRREILAAHDGEGQLSICHAPHELHAEDKRLIDRVWAVFEWHWAGPSCPTDYYWIGDPQPTPPWGWPFDGGVLEWTDGFPPPDAALPSGHLPPDPRANAIIDATMDELVYRASGILDTAGLRMFGPEDKWTDDRGVTDPTYLTLRKRWSDQYVYDQIRDVANALAMEGRLALRGVWAVEARRQAEGWATVQRVRSEAVPFAPVPGPTPPVRIVTPRKPGEITDQDIVVAVMTKVRELKDTTKIRELVLTYDPKPGRRVGMSGVVGLVPRVFKATEIEQKDRADFLAELEALS